jgi:peptidoglycan hydrolase-like protein with peptidoglycan-binding domain
MARFRRSGTNWEGRRWYTTPGLNALMDEIEAAYPGRHAADGTVASKSHDANNPSSDHRPTPYTGTGRVRAVDAGETVEGDGATLAEALRSSRDPRIRYVIHEGRIFASYSRSYRPAWTWGSNRGHEDHVHVSVTELADSDGSAWNLGLGGQIGDDEMSLKRGDSGNAVTKFQQALMAERSGALPQWGADSQFGGETEAAVKDYQRRAELPQTGVIDGVVAALLLEYVADRVGGGVTEARAAQIADGKVAKHAANPDAHHE